MQHLWPLIRVNAIAAAIFSFLLAILFPLAQRLPVAYQSPVLMIFTVAYIMVANRYLVRTVPPADLFRPRKGSFKPEKGRGWRIARWVLGVILAGMAVQLATFTLVYTVTRYVVNRLLGL